MVPRSTPVIVRDFSRLTRDESSLHTWGLSCVDLPPLHLTLPVRRLLPL